MGWANLGALTIGAAVAVIGGLHNVPGLLALGGTIVGGVLGNAMPSRPGGHGVVDAPTNVVALRARARRRRPTPEAFGTENTLRNRLPPSKE